MDCLFLMGFLTISAQEGVPGADPVAGVATVFFLRRPLVTVIQDEEQSPGEGPTSGGDVLGAAEVDGMEPPGSRLAMQAWRAAFHWSSSTMRFSINRSSSSNSGTPKSPNNGGIGSEGRRTTDQRTGKAKAQGSEELDCRTGT